MRTICYFLLFGALMSACGSTGQLEESGTSGAVFQNETSAPVMIVKRADTMRVVQVNWENVDTTKQKETVEINLQRLETFNHTAWDLLLKGHVLGTGEVDYEGFRNDKGLLRDYIASLGTNMPKETWTQEDKLAYWMNAYNAMTVDLILRNLPLESIKDIYKPWDQRLWKLGSKWYNLDEIEHKILRKMGDPRIHFGINCASFSCPPLLNEAFTAQSVDVQLDLLARRFINDPKRNIISEDKLQLSKLFLWFSKDFKSNGTLIDFLSVYSEKPIHPKARISYLTYDWSLNK